VNLQKMLIAAEAASPASAVSAAADFLADELGAEQASFLIADAAGQALIDLGTGARVPLDDSVAGSVWRNQEVWVEGDGTAWAPVTVRGDALGVVRVAGIEPRHDASADGVRESLGAVGHLLAYVIVANQRHTDRYEVGRRSEPFGLGMEIQRRLLPNAFVCEGGSFTLAGWLEPNATASGDTFDYVASADRLTVTLTDAVGHDVAASLLATLAVNAFRNARRAGGDLRAQAWAAHETLLEHASVESYATGVLMEVPLSRPSAESADERGLHDGLMARLVNAGHPPPRLIRDGRLTDIEVGVDPPLGMPFDHEYSVHEFALQPEDRLVLLTDGMFERNAAALELDKLLLETADAHPRNAVQRISAGLRERVGGTPDDDATMLLLDWHGGTTRRETQEGADVGTAEG
jgi:hypothetical protein